MKTTRIKARFEAQDDEHTAGRVRATVGSETFTGRVVEHGHDGVPVVYVRDDRGRRRAVRPSYPNHTVAPVEDALEVSV